MGHWSIVLLAAVIFLNSLSIAFAYSQVSHLRGELRWMALVTAPRALTTSGERAPASPDRITIDLYSDFSCRFCRKSVPVVDSVRQQFGDRVRWVFHPTPLSPERDPLGFNAALTAVCLGDGDSFWRFYSAIRDTAWNERIFLDAKRASGVSAASLADCVGSPAVEDVVWRALFDAGRRRVLRSPTIFVDHTMIEGELTYSAFSALVTQRLQHPSFLVRRGKRVSTDSLQVN